MISKQIICVYGARVEMEYMYDCRSLVIVVYVRCWDITQNGEGGVLNASGKYVTVITASGINSNSGLFIF